MRSDRPGASRGYRVFIDFDGTLVLPNVAILLVEEFGRDGVQVARTVDTLLHEGTISLREAWEREVAVLPPDRLEEMTRFAVAHVPLRPGARRLIDLLDRHRIPATVVSGGVEFYIRAVLDREGIRWPVLSDALERGPDGALAVRHPLGHPTCRVCGICKAQIVRSDPTRVGVFIGDGSTDRYAAEVADVVFARHRLQDYCRRRGVPHLPFEDLDPVADWFVDRLGDPGALPVRDDLGREDSICPISVALADGGRSSVPTGSEPI